MNCVIWLTGLSGSGKTTISNNLKKKLTLFGHDVVSLDGDELRRGPNSDLKFDDQSRKESVRRTSTFAKILLDQGFTVIVSLISPFDEDRLLAKREIGEENFVLVHVDCPISVCMERDTKSLYKMSKEKKIKNMTGIDSPYEIPIKADVKVETTLEDVDQCSYKIIDHVSTRVRQESRH